LAFATFLVWRLGTGACDIGACGFWRYPMPPEFSSTELNWPKIKLATILESKILVSLTRSQRHLEFLSEITHSSLPYMDLYAFTNAPGMGTNHSTPVTGLQALYL